MTKRMPHPFRIEDAEDFVIQVASQDPARANTFVIEHEAEGPIGVIGLFEGEDRVPETGYWIGRDYWGRGFATEALDGALVWAGRRWKRRALVAGHFADNPASGRVLEKAGFLYTGETRRAWSRARGAEAEREGAAVDQPRHRKAGVERVTQIVIMRVAAKQPRIVAAEGTRQIGDCAFEQGKAVTGAVTRTQYRIDRLKDGGRVGQINLLGGIGLQVSGRTLHQGTQGANNALSRKPAFRQNNKLTLP